MLCNPMAEPSLLVPTAFVDLSFPAALGDDLPEFPLPIDDTFAFEDFDLDDLDVDFYLDLFSMDVQLPPPSLATSSSSVGSLDGGSSFFGAGGDVSLRNEESSESSSRSRNAGSDGKPKAGDEENAKRHARLVRNRESAHLSQERKKQYVEVLEGR